MGGGLMQLVAYGAQDIYLTGNPQITFFKVVYRRHTNFSIESIQQTFSGTAKFGGQVVATISRNGDLIHKIYMEHEAYLKTPGGTTDDHMAIGCDYGSHVMKEYEVDIGGQTIDKQYGHWHSVYQQLTEFNPTGNGIVANSSSGSPTGDTLYNRMTGNGFGFEPAAPYMPAGSGTKYRGWTRTTAGNSGDDSGHGAKINGKFWIPLYFWFCRNPGLALPLIALQYHEVKIKIKFESLAQLIIIGAAGGFTSQAHLGHIADPNSAIDTGGTSFNLWVDYIYLDTDERRRFAQVSHEYLIEQLQFQTFGVDTTNDLNFNHPVKELIWTGVRPVMNSANVAKFTCHGDYQEDRFFARGCANNITVVPTFNGPTKGDKWLLKLNGHDRFAERPYQYFTRAQIWQNHTGYGGSNTELDSIAVYSFSLKPEEHQPSGTCNFSRIDVAQLISTTKTELNVYAVNYNVLRIMSGMGGLAYSN